MTLWPVPRHRLLQRWLSTLFVIAPGFLWALPTNAQTPSLCQPPAAGEYVLLVDSQTEDERQRLEQVLPTGADVVPCQYLNQPVIRVGTFENEELARSWADYLTNIEGFQTTVARPPDSPDQAASEAAAENPAQPTPAQPGAQTDTTATYSPAVLDTGYAVLVRYFNRPEIAAAVQTVLNAPVGLAVYEQEPYLLVAYSPDPAAAGQVLQGLSDRQFSAFMVNSRQVVVLTPSVAITPVP
jgi:hypothetical protein